ncbi:23S rRNA (uracil(1939)-C(5))-methyltransferase RlmD [Atopobiaceae bacterium 24-176]
MGFATPTCPIAKRCGGCEWLAVPYPIQLRRKREWVVELFSDLLASKASAVSADDVAITGMEVPREYRHKAATPFAPGKGGVVRSGFYERGSHRIVPCAACLAEDPRCRPALNDVARMAERLKIRAYDEDKGRGMLRHAVVRTGWKTNEGLLTIVTNGNTLAHGRELAEAVAEAAPLQLSIVQNINQRRTNAILGPTSKPLLGPGVMHDSLLGVTFEIGPTSFYQTNPEQTEALYRLAIEGARLEPGQTLLDAYCGIGTIGLCAAKTTDGVSVVGVERVEGAVADARRNARMNGLDDRTRFVCADATAYLADSKRNRAGFDVVVLDPPRAGATEAFLGACDGSRCTRIVYVSCNPVTQRRDMDYLCARGWLLESLAVVDMFPHTKHAETVAVLSRQ